MNEHKNTVIFSCLYFLRGCISPRLEKFIIFGVILKGDNVLKNVTLERRLLGLLGGVSQESDKVI